MVVVAKEIASILDDYSRSIFVKEQLAWIKDASLITDCGLSRSVEWVEDCLLSSMHLAISRQNGIGVPTQEPIPNRVFGDD